MSVWGENQYGDEDFDRDVLGALSPSEVMTRGKAQHMIADDVVAFAEERVHGTGVLDLLEQWKREDGIADASQGGRPILVTEKAVLVGMLLLAQDQKPMHLTELTELFLHRLTNASRVLLGLPEPANSFTLRSATHKRWYNNTHRAFHRINRLVDPFPVNRRHAKYYTEIKEILDNHDVNFELARRARLDEFTQRFLKMTYGILNREIRRKYKTGDISFDQTYIRMPNPTGYSRRTLGQKVAAERKHGLGVHTPGPVDPYGGWHVKGKDRKDHTRSEFAKSDPDGLNTRSATYKWGLMANIAVRVDSGKKDGALRFPQIVTAANLSLPNIEVAEEAVKLMAWTKDLGLSPGIADADMQYWANSIVERLHEPAIGMGWTPSSDIRIDRVGPRDGKEGAVFLEGNAYCPATPAPLLNATADKKKDVIDIATFLERKKQQKAFRLHQKEKPDAQGRVVMRCPALGPSPTVTCPLRELAMSAAKKPRPAVDQDNLPDFPDKICEQHSVTFQDRDFQRERQAFEWGTPEWEGFHQHARNSIESINGQAKDNGAEALEAASRRRIRGFSAAQIIITMLLVNFNIRKLASFVDDHSPGGKPAATGIERARDTKHRNSYIGTYPEWVTAPPEKKRRSTGDGTGGPPTDL